MKKIFTISIFFYYSIISSAQISKGSVLLGGDVSAFLEKQVVNSQEFDNNGIFISPLFGKAIRDNSVIGLYIGLGYSRNENDQSWNLIESNIYGAGLFLRHYKAIKNNFYGFLQGNLGYLYSKSKYEQPGSGYESKYSEVRTALSPGLSYRISRKLHLEAGLRELASIGYSISENRNYNVISTSTNESKRFSISTSLDNFTSNLYFGFRLLIDKK